MTTKIPQKARKTRFYCVLLAFFAIVTVEESRYTTKEKTMKKLKFLAIPALMFTISSLLDAGMADRGIFVYNKTATNVTIVIKGAENNILARLNIAPNESAYQEITPQEITKVIVNGQELTACSSGDFADLQAELYNFEIGGTSGAYTLMCQASDTE